MFFWLSWPALWLYLRGSTRCRVIVESDGQILLVKGWHDGEKWSLPGGGLHKGEEPLLSAVREVFEETGIRLEPDQLLELGNDTYNERGLRYGIKQFGCKLAEQPATHKQHLELIAIKWFDPKDITPKLVEPNVMRQLASWQQMK